MMQELEEIHNMNNIDRIREFLADEADYLLNFNDLVRLSQQKTRDIAKKLKEKPDLELKI